MHCFCYGDVIYTGIKSKSEYDQQNVRKNGHPLRIPTYAVCIQFIFCCLLILCFVLTLFAARDLTCMYIVYACLCVYVCGGNVHSNCTNDAPWGILFFSLSFHSNSSDIYILCTSHHCIWSNPMKTRKCIKIKLENRKYFYKKEHTERNNR